jgi:hypothetical protein
MKSLRLIAIVLGATVAFAGCESQQNSNAVPDKIMSLEKRLAAAEKTIETLKEDQGTGVPSLRARKFVLADENGKSRASLWVDKDGPILALVDANGKIRAMLMVDTNGPRLALADENGKTRALLGSETLTRDGKTINYPESTLTLSGPDGKVLWKTP